MKTRRCRTVCGDNGFEVVAFPPLLLAVAVGGLRGGSGYFLGLIDRRFLKVGAIHHCKRGSVGGQLALLVDLDWSP